MKKGFLIPSILFAIFIFIFIFSYKSSSAEITMPFTPSGMEQSKAAAEQYYGVDLDTGEETSYEKHNDGTFTEVFQTMYATILIWYTKGVTWVAKLAGWVFDKTIDYTTKYPTELENGIYGSWKIVRDFANIILVFSLLYLGIKTIIEGQGFADKKVLVGVIIAAIFINFSFFFTKDIAFNISNTIGRQIMEQAKMSESKSYSEGFMKIVQPQKVIEGKWGSGGKDLAWNSTWDMLFKYTGQIILLSVVVLILGVIFIGVSITLIYRLLIFIFIIITSPFGLISTQIPWLKSLGSDWLKQLKHQSIYFPAFAIILYIVLYIVAELAMSVKSVDISNGFGDSLLEFIFRFILIIGFMFGLLILPNKLGAAGSDMMTSAGGYLKNKITNLPRGTARLASGATARTGRYFIGNKFANVLGAKNNEDKLKKLQEQARGTGFSGVKARLRLQAADKLKDKSFDFRNTKLGESAGLGKGIESYSAAVSSKKKKYEDKMDQEKKLYGYDKLGKSNEDRQEIMAAEVERDTLGKKVEGTRKEYEKEKKSGSLSSAELQEITDRLVNEEKDLEDAEELVGKLKSKGNTEYIKLLERQRKNVLFVGRRVSRTQKAGLEKLKKDLEKKWKEDGKYVEKEKKNTGSSSTVTIGSGGGTTSI